MLCLHMMVKNSDFTLVIYFTYMYLFIHLYMCIHIEAREPLEGVGSLYCVSGIHTACLVLAVGGKYLCLLSHLSGPYILV